MIQLPPENHHRFQNMYKEKAGSFWILVSVMICICVCVSACACVCVCVCMCMNIDR